MKQWIGRGRAWLGRHFPPVRWLPQYRFAWLTADMAPGVMLAAYAIPVSLAYATLAGLPPQVGIYGYLLGGLGYAVLGSSRQLAIGPTSAISLMVAGTVGAMAEGDAIRYAQIASLAGFAVALLCLVSWLLRLSILVRLISDSILVGFKAGAGLTIILTQLPQLFGVAGGGQNFAERAVRFAGQLGDTNLAVLAFGAVADLVPADRRACLAGEAHRTGGRRAIDLPCVRLRAFRLGICGAGGDPPRGCRPSDGRSCACSTSRIFPLAAGCLLLAYIESVSAARSFAEKHGYALDTRQEFLGLGAANLAAAFGHGYPVAGGLSQSAVNDAAGARTPLALVFASLALGLCLLFFAGVLANLPKTVLAATMLVAVYKLIDAAALYRLWRISRVDFYAAAIALAAVLALEFCREFWSRRSHPWW